MGLEAVLVEALAAILVLGYAATIVSVLDSVMEIQQEVSTKI